MGNLKNFNFNKIDGYLSNYKYYDFYLAQDEQVSCCMYDGIIVSGDCFVVHYDFNEAGIYASGTTSADTICSLVTWTGATNTGYTLNTFGLTGIDNGYITFDKTTGDTSNSALLSAITGTTIVIPSGDTRLCMTRVTGMTENYVYPIDIISGNTTLGDYSRLCGGFYQGYYKLDGYSYEVLPIRVPKAWTAEFWLNKSDTVCSGTTGTTLNDTYPNNKGFFFYMGTRAENKYWNVFEGLNTGCTINCTSDTGCTGTVTTFCTVPKETQISISGDSGYPISLSPPPLEIRNIENEFLIYGRASNNPKCGSCGGDISGFGNKTVCTFTGFTSDLLILDKDADIIDNAIGFRIKDDGSIGYRALKLTGYCSGDTYVTGVTVEEQYSISGMVTDNQWTHIGIRFVMPEYEECQLKYGKQRKGRLMFYVNSKLKFVAEEVDEFIARRLNEYKDKQLGVPFNYSLGGGSQGLLESMTFDGQDPDDLGLIIEQNFAGTFIGDISQFRYYICDLNWCDLTNNFEVEKIRYGIKN